MMNERDFCYWLNGFVELTQGQTPNPAQWKSIKEHLDLVFKKVTPAVDVEQKITLDPRKWQTGPVPGAPDPIAGKSMEEILKQYWTHSHGQQADGIIITC
ncbi:hypothetical protein [Paraburkholderia sp. J11-2]|uniref:hypothetical protein n=1 Tax=Paraburkholderia sp. J11-2 TaxID=2805431 RepID=UPI002AB6844F|nr:hypothetical protein [Paraburkholderia sp. J11-2]